MAYKFPQYKSMPIFTNGTYTTQGTVCVCFFLVSHENSKGLGFFTDTNGINNSSINLQTCHMVTWTSQDRIDRLLLNGGLRYLTYSGCQSGQFIGGEKLSS